MSLDRRVTGVWKVRLKKTNLYALLYVTFHVHLFKCLIFLCVFMNVSQSGLVLAVLGSRLTCFTLNETSLHILSRLAVKSAAERTNHCSSENQNQQQRRKKDLP